MARKQEELVAQGVQAMLANVLQDIQAPAEMRQLQGLKALQGLARNASIFLPLQSAFREAGGFPLLVRLLDVTMLPGQHGSPPALSARRQPASPASEASHSGSTQEAGDDVDAGSSSTHEEADVAAQRLAPAVEALAMLARNNPKNRGAAIQAGAVLATKAADIQAARAAAIQAGAVPALCSVLATGMARPVPIALEDVLKALYALAAADASGSSASELFASGGIHSLVRLLGQVLDDPEDGRCRVWARELVELLYPLAAHSRIVAALLLQELPVFVRLLGTLGDPLTLSLGLDVFEELLAALGSRARNAIVAEGGLGPLVRLLHMGGLGSKAALLLATLTSGSSPAPMRALRALLQPDDLAALVHLALLASHAQDLDAEACRQLLEGLVGGPDLGIVRGLLLGRDCGPCLSMPGVDALLADRMASEEGLLLLAALGAQHPVEAAIGAAELLLHRPAPAASALLRSGRVRVLVGAALAEAVGRSEAGEAGRRSIDGEGSDAVMALSDALGFLCASADSRLRAASIPSPAAAGSSGELVATEASEQLQQPPVRGNGGGETIVFVVGGRDIEVGRAAIEEASPVVASTLSRIPRHSDTKVVVPPIPGLEPEAAAAAFEVAAQFLSSAGARTIEADQVVDVWLLCANLQLSGPQAVAEAALPAALADCPAALPAALAAASLAGSVGGHVRETALVHLARNLGRLHDEGALAPLVRRFGDALHTGLAALMIRQLQPLAPNGPSRQNSSNDLSRRNSAFLSARSYSVDGCASGAATPSAASASASPLALDRRSIGGFTPSSPLKRRTVSGEGGRSLPRAASQSSIASSQGFGRPPVGPPNLRRPSAQLPTPTEQDQHPDFRSAPSQPSSPANATSSPSGGASAAASADALPNGRQQEAASPQSETQAAGDVETPRAADRTPGGGSGSTDGSTGGGGAKHSSPLYGVMDPEIDLQRRRSVEDASDGVVTQEVLHQGRQQDAGRQPEAEVQRGPDSPQQQEGFSKLDSTSVLDQLSRSLRF